MERDFIDLYELQSRLKEGVQRLFPAGMWLKAEIGAIKARPGGHCYMELSQSGDNGLVAKAQAVIWSSRYRFIAPYFESVTGSPLQEGMLVLIRVQVSFSQLYGLSLVVEDIDPGFSIGESERVRRLTVERLRNEGLLGMQAELELPRLPYRLAVISAPDAAGYRDFMRHLHENTYGFVFHTDLFAAQMQGADAPGSIISAMDAVAEDSIGYDLLLILRGGGARLDLACYDDYDLAAHISQFPIPVFTAVGHDQDYHVCDMAAHTYVKTPTALADEMLGFYMAEDEMLLSLNQRLAYSSSMRFHAAELELRSLSSGIVRAFSGKLSLMDGALSVFETRIHAADPYNILKRGYALAVDGGGVVLKNAGGVKAGDRLSVMFLDGTLGCLVENVRDNDDK